MNPLVTLTATERVVLGRPCAEVLAEEAERLDAKRIFLMASASLEQDTDTVDKVRSALGPRLADTYTGMPPHTPRTAVLDAAAQARAASADLIVTLGGGSLTDGGKLVQLCLRHDLRSVEDFDPFPLRVHDDGRVEAPEFAGPNVRQITVPTTLSGGEFNPLGGCTDPRRQEKQGYFHRLHVPLVVILDPAATLHTPEWLWFSTGVRAFDHAVETLASLQSNDFCDAQAEAALARLVAALPRVKSDPLDLDARLACQIGVWLSMIPMTAGVPMGASHAIGHILGGTCNVPHGYTSCVLSPFVVRFNEGVNDHRQKRIAAAMGEPDRSASELVDGFIRSLGMPRTLRDVGVREEQFQQIAEYSMADYWTRTNPRPIRSPDDVMEILRMAQ